MSFRNRDENSHWKNDSIITDKFEALSILNLGRTTRYPHRLEKAGVGENWEITFYWYRGVGYGHGGIDYYEVSPELVEHLKKNELVEQEGPVHGRFVISHKGKSALEMYMMGMKAEALTLIKPGVHTDLAGEPQGGSAHRDGFRCGKLYFEFICPEKKTCRIYPATKEIVFPA